MNRLLITYVAMLVMVSLGALTTHICVTEQIASALCADSGCDSGENVPDNERDGGATHDCCQFDHCTHVSVFFNAGGQAIVPSPQLCRTVIMTHPVSAAPSFRIERPPIGA